MHIAQVARPCCLPTPVVTQLSIIHSCCSIAHVAGKKFIKHQPISSLTKSVGLCFATFELRNLKPLAVEAGRHRSAQPCTRDRRCTRVLKQHSYLYLNHLYDKCLRGSRTKNIKHMWWSLTCASVGQVIMGAFIVFKFLKSGKVAAKAAISVPGRPSKINSSQAVTFSK